MEPDHPLTPALGIEGATTEPELMLLYELAQTVRDGVIVEIGAWRGRSTAALALGSRQYKKAPVYSIEPHEDFQGFGARYDGAKDRACFFANMARLELLDVVRLINLSSEVVTAAWPYAVGLLWIDGDHGYRAVRRDVLCWLPHLRPDAIVAFHDADESEIRLGPYHVVEELVASGQWERTAAVDRIKVLTRNFHAPLFLPRA